MKKILFMVYNMHLGGVEKSLVDLLRVLCKRDDLKITLLLIDYEGEFLSRVPSSVEIRRCRLPYDIYLQTIESTARGISSALKKCRVLIAGKLVASWLRHRGKNQQQVLQDNYSRWSGRLNYEPEIYDMAIDYQGMGVFTTYYVANFVKAKIKCTWVHNDFSVMIGSLNWQKDLYAKYNKVFCVSKQAMEITVDRMDFVSNKIDIFHNIIPKDEIFYMSQMPGETLQGKCRILTVGRLSYQKGYDIAFRVMYALSKKGYDIDYYVIGEGEQRRELEQLIEQLELQNIIHLLGYQSNPYVYLKQCDIYLQPSRYEGFCITLGEAKLFDKPIITTDFAGAREQIIHEETGLIVPCEEESMLVALERMSSNNELRNKFITNLKKESVRERNDCDKMMRLLS